MTTLCRLPTGRRPVALNRHHRDASGNVSGAVIDVDLLGLEIRVERVPPELAPHAALLVATPQRLTRRRLAVVDPHDARSDTTRGVERQVDVAGPNRRGQAVFGVVGLTDHLVRVLESEDGGHRTEDL